MRKNAVRRMTGSVGPVALIVMGVFGFALQDTAVKLLAEDVSIWQLMLVRSTAVLGLLAVFAASIHRGGALVPVRWGWPLVRAVVMCCAHVFLYMAIAFLPVTTAAATFFTGPLIIALMAALILREPTDPGRIVAVLAGFAGVLVIIRPGFEGFRPATLLALVAAFCYASGTIITRLHCREEANFSLVMVHNLLYANIGMLGVLLLPALGFSPDAAARMPFVLEGWREPSLLAAVLMPMTAVTHMLSTLFIVHAYQNEEAGKLAPFEYTYLIFVPVFEFALWRTWPDEYTLVGMAMIVAAGVFVSWRERVSARLHMSVRSADAQSG